ncbi:hypothetical protein K438DRAFT_2097747 [Mycena galopus ATCC 62051]|nr:hypothetical protein K438DRAFT_2097747 [Mycena galopus ATCC 62051]
MANPQNTKKEKEWKGLKVTPIVEDEDGSNNYCEFKQKAMLDLDAAGYWKYVAGEDYNPPIIPDLIPSMQVQGLDTAGNLAKFTMPGNEAAINDTKKKAEAWLMADKKAHALIVKAVPSAHLYLVHDCRSAHDAWMALKREYEPSNALTAITIKQQIIAYRCDANEDPVNWWQVMIQLYGKLRDADPFMMPDNEFAKHLVTLMWQSNKWRYCCDSLREKVCQGDAMQNPVSSSYVISRLKEEEVEMQIAPSIVSINALVTGKARNRAFNATNTPGADAPNAYAAGPSGQSSHQNGRRIEKGNQCHARRPAPYSSQQCSGSRPFCENMFCETPMGHSKADCFSYRGGKVGKYPENFCGRKDVHLAPEARIAAHRKLWRRTVGATLLECCLGGSSGWFCIYDIHIDEEIHVNAAALNLEVTQDDTVNHDTGASHHIFHRRELFHDYVQFDTLLNVHGFGANLSAQAVGKGKIVMTAIYDGRMRQFSVSNALHIPTAHCNLISGSRIDKKGVSTHTGSGKITYLNAAEVPFACGSIVRDLYKINVEMVKPDGVDTPDLIAVMVPSVTSLFGPGTENADSQRLGFITV